MGVKLLERMGWQEGKGLGKKEAGMQSFVRAKLKNDTVGIGASKGAAAGDERQNAFAQATTDMFNALLSKLNAVHSDATPSPQPQDEPPSGSEERKEAEEEEDTTSAGDAAASIDRYVRKRHLYGRFSRAKDTSLYSHKSKLEIFGRKQHAPDALVNQQQPAALLLPPPTAAAAAESESASVQQPSIATTTSSVSIQSYFASKLAARQHRTQQQPLEAAADGSREWQAALFDDISQRSQSGRAGLGATRTATHTSTASATSGNYTNTNSDNNNNNDSHYQQSPSPRPSHSTLPSTLRSSSELEGASNSDNERRDRAMRRRERKEAKRLERQRKRDSQEEEEEEEEEHSQQEQRQRQQEDQQVLSLATEATHDKRRRKKQKLQKG